MPDDDGRQSGWYAIGGALAAAGCALFPLGLATTPRSRTLQFLGFTAFIAGLAIIAWAMTVRRPGGRKASSPVASRAGPGDKGRSAKPPGSGRARVLTLVTSLLAIAIGGFVIFGQGQSQDNQETTGPVVVAAGGATDTYTGPSASGYTVKNVVPANTHIRIICTAYGAPLSFGNKNALWDFTDLGWLNDHYVSTGTASPTAPGCTGSTGDPRPGTELPTKASGPYAVIADEGNDVPVRIHPATSASVAAELPAGRFVRIQCTAATGPVIPAPRALGPPGSDNVWDRIGNPAGWVPDSYVATYATVPVAPAC